MGKYQMIQMDSMSALILDTEEGHIWAFAADKEQGFVLMYHGQVSVADRPGQLVFHIER